ncbi:MAG: choice-of-anchor tandem repeat GloVer-containing protein [Terriglobales bacterium]
MRLKSFHTSPALILIICLVAAIAPAADAQTFDVLYNFGSNSGDPSESQGLLVQGRDGNLYGTSYSGGSHDLGTVFMSTPAAALTVLYSFDGTHGANPYGGLTLGTDGNFYGTTAFGGTFNDGTIFKIPPDGKLRVLYNFTNGSDGETPWTAPIEGTDGNFYGTTCGCPYGGAFAGTVYKITPSGKLTTLHQFAPNARRDGVNPQDALIQATDGSFYGTATNQGTYDRGTVFKITARGKFTVIHTFDGVHGGRASLGTYAQLVQGSDGDLYAPTPGGGKFGDGVVYKVTPGGDTPLSTPSMETMGLSPTQAWCWQQTATSIVLPPRVDPATTGRSIASAWTTPFPCFTTSTVLRETSRSLCSSTRMGCSTEIHTLEEPTATARSTAST